jgi:pimeloyl-ACP methyl ester carboxylesterase
MDLELLHEPPSEGPSKGTVLLLHGACMGAWCWNGNFLQWFAEKGYDTYAMSLRNHGNSARKGSLRFRRIREYVKDLRTVVDSLPGPVHVIGHSMGGFTLQHYLANPSLNLGKAVLLCSAPSHGAWKLVGKLMGQHPLLFAKSNVLMSWKPIIAGKENAREIMFRPDFPEGRLMDTLAKLQDESFIAFLDMLFLDLPDTRKVKTPLMIVGTGEDYLVPVSDTKKMASRYRVPPYIIANASHNFFMETGWEDTAEKILSFIGS